MELHFKKASAQDLDVLLEARIAMLKAVNNAPESADFSEVEKSCRAYYLDSFARDTHVAYLVFDGEEWVGCGGISFYQTLPSYKNPSGMRAYIMNIYTAPRCRGQGVASRMVDLLVEEAHLRNIKNITLVATDAGRPVYERYGFVPDHGAMELS